MGCSDREDDCAEPVNSRPSSKKQKFESKEIIKNLSEKVRDLEQKVQDLESTSTNLLESVKDLDKRVQYLESVRK